MITQTAQEFKNKATASISFNSETSNVYVELYVSDIGFSASEIINLLKKLLVASRNFYIFVLHS